MSDISNFGKMRSTDFGQNIRAELSNRKRSISWLAKESGISQCMISYYLCGKAEPTLSKALRIASALHIPLSQLVGEDVLQPKTLLSIVCHKEEIKKELLRHYSDTALLTELGIRLEKRNG